MLKGARGAQLCDCLGVEAELVENLPRVFAELRGATRTHFRRLVEVHRTVDRQPRSPAAIVDGHQDVVGNELWVVGDLLKVCATP